MKLLIRGCRLSRLMFSLFALATMNACDGSGAAFSGNTDPASSEPTTALPEVTEPTAEAEPTIAPEPAEMPEVVDKTGIDSSSATLPLINGWSNPATWPDGQVPAVGANVSIVEGATVILDTDVTVGNLMVNGTLLCDESNLNLSANNIMVRGLFECGTGAEPHTKNLTVTLYGSPDSPETVSMGSKVLGVMDGGELSLHGEPRDSWVFLSETAQPGDTRLILEQAVDWRVNETLVIAATDAREETESVAIKAVNGNIVDLKTPLRFRHFAQIQHFSNDKGRVWTADTRAEVGLVDRNIRIQGDQTSSTSKFGGHIMTMPESSMYLSGVMLVRMGQEGSVGRYPVHWHLTGDVRGQYVKNSAIVESFNRCVTVHGAHQALIEDNLCYGFIGNGFFLEDGIETKNIFRHNLAVSGRASLADKSIIPEDSRVNGMASLGPAAFWISNADNSYIGNAAADVFNGYWYKIDKAVKEPSLSHFPQASSIDPNQSAVLEFSDNRVHTAKQGWSACNAPGGPAGYSAPGRHLIQNLLAYKVQQGAIWPCGAAFEFNQLKVLDSGFTPPNGKFGMRAAFVSPVEFSSINNALFVGNSALDQTTDTDAFGLYDFGLPIRHSHIANYQRRGPENQGSAVFVAVTSAMSRVSTRLEDVSFDNVDFWLAESGKLHNSLVTSFVYDTDGSMGFGANRTLMPTLTTNVFATNDCDVLSDEATICSERFANILIDTDRPRGVSLPVYKPGLHLPGQTERIWHGVEQPKGRPHYSSAAAVNTIDRHNLGLFDPAFFTDYPFVAVTFREGSPGDAILYEFRNMPAQSRVRQASFVKETNLARLKIARRNTWYYENNRLYVKVFLTGDSAFNARTTFHLDW